MPIKIIKTELMVAKEIREIIDTSIFTNKTYDFFKNISEAKLIAAIDKLVCTKTLLKFPDLLERVFDIVSSHWKKSEIIHEIFKKLFSCFALESISEVYEDLSYCAVRGGGIVRPILDEVVDELLKRVKKGDVEFDIEMRTFKKL